MINWINVLIAVILFLVVTFKFKSPTAGFIAGTIAGVLLWAGGLG